MIECELGNQPLNYHSYNEWGLSEHDYESWSFQGIFQAVRIKFVGCAHFLI